MVKRGDIFLADLGTPAGSRQGGIRPVIVIQNDTGNKYSPTTLICPLTSKEKKNLPTHIRLKENEAGIDKESIAMFEQITVLDKEFLIKKLGEIENSETLKAINERIMISFGLQ